MEYKTRVEKVEVEALAKYKEVIQLGAQLIQQGDLVAFPTETVYGLGADASSSQAVEKIFLAKGRPQDNPLIVHISKLEQVNNIIKGDLPDYAQKLIDFFWPGPLTIIFTKNDLLPAVTTANLDSVAIRMPAHPIAQALINKANLPLAAPSANLSSLPSPTLAQHVYQDLKGRLPLIIDGGPCQLGLESTVVDVRGEKPLILRPGGITREEITNLLGMEILVNKRKDSKPVSPGMKYQHYSPHTPLILISSINKDKIEKIVSENKEKKIALVLTKETKDKLTAIPIKPIIEIGSKKNLAMIATKLFAMLRELDQDKFDLIIIETIEEIGIGEAIMNRLKKAALKII